MKKDKKDFFFGVSSNLPKIVELDLKLISPNPDQPRKTFNEESLRELAASIERHGLLSPVSVKRREDGEEGYILVAGERRFRAHQLLGRETIFSIVLTQGNTDELALIENVQREDLNPIEEAEALVRLMERYKYTQEQLGQVIGKAQNTVSTLLRLNTLPEEIKREYPTSDNISKSVLIELARYDNKEEQLRIWQEIREGNTTVREARKAKKDSTVPKRTSSPAEQVLSVGRSFTRKLSHIQPRDIVENRDQYIELLELRQEINKLVDNIHAEGEA